MEPRRRKPLLVSPVGIGRWVRQGLPPQETRRQKMGTFIGTMGWQLFKVLELYGRLFPVKRTQG
jgi:hypothetical protein